MVDGVLSQFSRTPYKLSFAKISGAWGRGWTAASNFAFCLSAVLGGWVSFSKDSILLDAGGAVIGPTLTPSPC